MVIEEGGRLPRARRDCGDLDMRIARDGTWYYRGSPIGRKPLVQLFASVLKREPDGSYWLETPVERGRITVDDVPFTIVEIASEGSGRGRSLRMRTNLDAWIAIGPAHPLRAARAEDGATLVYAGVAPGLDARLLTAPFYELVDLALDDADGADELAIWSGGSRFVLGPIAD